LVGRDKEIEALLNFIIRDPITLVLGDSGVGKTSLIHAGLITAVAEKGWRAIYTRPLGVPSADIARQVQSAVFEGEIHYRGPLVPLLAEITTTLEKNNILLIIDQFEDILNAKSEDDIKTFISDLAMLRNAAPPTLHTLIAYRADLEGRLGQYWQLITGSPYGLPRLYIRGISLDQAWRGIEKTISDLKIRLNLKNSEKERIINDLAIASRAAGFQDVYPPYLQIFVDHVWLTKDTGGKYNMKAYNKIGGMEGIVGGYLTQQLDYAQDNEGHIQLVLIALVRSYGVKAQRTLGEIVSDTGLDIHICELCLEKLIDLRLVRHIEEFYEISHDYIAKKIMHELVDSQEKEFKRFRELLSVKGAAYETTRATLTSEEMLMLYKYRHRVVPNETDLRLLLASWIEEKGPALYWLLKAVPAKILQWLSGEASRDDLSKTQNLSIILLRRKLGECALEANDYSTFRGYKMTGEIVSLIKEESEKLPVKVLCYGLQHSKSEVQSAALNEVCMRVKSGDWSWIKMLRNSQSESYHRAYKYLVLRKDISSVHIDAPKIKALEEFRILHKMAFTESPSEITKLFKEFKRLRSPRWMMRFGESLRLTCSGQIKRLLKKALQSSYKKTEDLLAGISGKIDASDIELLFSMYEEWNSRERSRFDFDKEVVYFKAEAIANAIYRCMSKDHLGRLRKSIKKISLKTSSRPLVLSLLKYGDIKDLRLILNKIAESSEEIDFWDHTHLGHVVANRIRKIAKEIPKFLLGMVKKKEFWGEYFHKDSRDEYKNDILPLKSVTNRRLYIRLVAYSMIGASTEKDQELLIRLTLHNYSLIAAFSAMRLVEIIGEPVLSRLSAKVDDSVKKREVMSLVEALRMAEMQLFGLTRY
ncbi:MAG: hypothetical protein D4R93_03720, partial [Deltaproteobacteria bacterium]